MNTFPAYRIKNKEVEYKTVAFLVKSVDQDLGIVTGLASPVQNVDLQKDQVEPGAYKKTLAEAQSRMTSGRRFMYATLWMHDPMQPTGGVVSGQETSEGLLVTMQYDISVNAAGIPNNPTATMVFSGFKVGYIDELSIGYICIQRDYDKQGVRHLKEIQLIEISGVTMLFAANPEALVPASGVKTMADKTPSNDSKEKPARKDFNDLFQAAQASDCLEDWGDLINTLTQAMMQIFCMGDSPQPDMAACLEQFGTAVNAWLEKAVECNLAGYISDSYGNANAPYVPYSLRVGSDYMARHDLPSGKVGATISNATQGKLEAHQTEMKTMLEAHESMVAESCKALQQKVSDLTQLWQGEGQGPAYADDKDSNEKSRLTRREPLSPALSREGLQPLHKSTGGEVSIDDLEALLV
jgi:HK97 family phage prohead protease